MKSIGTWNQTDPRDAKILALHTQMQALQQAHQSHYPSINHQTQIKTIPKSDVEEWKMVKTSYHVFKDDKHWYWCPHHIIKANPPGIYCLYTPQDHPKWVECKNNEYRNFKYGSPPQHIHQTSHATITNKKDSVPSLELDPKFKSVLMTKLDLSPNLMDEFMQDAMQTYQEK